MRFSKRFYCQKMSFQLHNIGTAKFVDTFNGFHHCIIREVEINESDYLYQAVVVIFSTFCFYTGLFQKIQMNVKDFLRIFLSPHTNEIKR